MGDVKSIKDVSRKELLTGGTFACAGCSAILGIKLMLKALGKNVIMVNSSGCMTLTADYPFTPYKVPWVHNAIENAAATASGILMGLRANKQKATIVCYAGDGATYDIGFQSLSGAASRNEDLIYICYNNATFANTGFQKSSGTPMYMNTSTTPSGKNNPHGNIYPRKHMPKIMASHGIPYVATAATSYPFDFINKLKKASKIKGTKYIELLSPCIPGWKIKESTSLDIGKSMVQAGLWPLYEVENGKFTLSLTPEMIPVKRALINQGRFNHLTKQDIAEIQAIINMEWEFLKKGKYWIAEEY